MADEEAGTLRFSGMRSLPNPAERMLGPKPKRSNARRAWRRFRQTRLAAPGLLVIALLSIAAIGARWVAPYDPYRQDYRAVLQAPSWEHPLGTDDLGRDLLSRLIYGGRISLQVGVIAVTLAVSGGLLVGLAAGYAGGWIDETCMRVMDALQAFPGLVLAMAVTAALGPSVRNVMIAVGVVAIPSFARLVRGQTLVVRELDFVLAARVTGVGMMRMMVRHILPNVQGPIIVQASLTLSFVILTEAGLSFLGLGAPPPTPSWGSMLDAAYPFMSRAPWMSIASGATIFVTVLALNFIGDGLKAAFDPRQARGREV